eukprot:637278_1
MALTSLECTDLDISQQEWLECLIQIDDFIVEMRHKSSDIVIISLPYKLHDIRTTMHQFVSQTFNNESLLYCCDIIINFIVPNNWIIQKKVDTNNANLSNNDQGKWTKQKYDALLSTESLIIINTKNCDYISIPRDTFQFDFSNLTMNDWKISWDEYDKNNTIYSAVNRQICDKIANTFLPKHFKFTTCDWTKRTDFTGETVIGYLCDNGEVAQGDLLRQQHDRIFVHFNTSAHLFGKKYDWIHIPNDRFCPPPKPRPYAPPRQIETYNVGGYGIGYDTYNRREMQNTVTSTYRSQEEADLHRAIDASLRTQDLTYTRYDHMQPQTAETSDEEDEDDFLQQAINGASQD